MNRCKRKIANITVNRQISINIVSSDVNREVQPTVEKTAVSRSSPGRIQWFLSAFVPCTCRQRADSEYHRCFFLSRLQVCDHEIHSKIGSARQHTNRKDDPRLSTPGLGRGSFLAVGQRKKPWCSTHFFQKFLHSSLHSKWNSTTSL